MEAPPIKIPRWYALFAATSTIIYLAYFVWSIRVHGYISSPGADQINHYSTVLNVENLGVKALFTGYPSAFHAAVLVLMKVFQASFVHVLLWLWPLCVVAGAWAVAALIRALTNSRMADLSIPFFLFALAQPVQTLEDGGFPSYIGVAIITPLILLGIISAQKAQWDWRKTWKPVVGFLFLGLFHHLTLLYLLAVALVILVLLAWRKPVFLGGGLLILLIFYLSPLGRVARDLFTTIFDIKGSFPWLMPRVATREISILSLRSYSESMGYLVWWTGIVSFVVVIIELIRKRIKPEHYIVLLALVALTALQLIASRMTVLAFPVRIARDVATPLFILGAYGVFNFWKTYKQPWVRAVFLLAIAWLSFPHVQDRFDRFYRFNPAMQLTPAVGNVLGNQDSATTVALNIPYAFVYDLRNLEIYTPPTSLASIPDDKRELLLAAEVVVFQVKPGEEPWEGDFLRTAGFHEVTMYSDPILNTYRYEK